MSAFSRRGACPALSAPMQTGDGLLVRVNPLAGGSTAGGPISGGLPPKSLIGLCESALRHGNGIMEVTARGSLQIRGLTADSARLLAAEVDALGITVRTGLPVETGPLAGLDPQEIADPRPLTEQIRNAVEEAGLTQRLGPKVSVVVDGGGRLGVDAVTADVRLAAVRSGAGTRWRIAIAGDARSAAPLAVVAEDAACDITIGILQAIAELGIEARARDLVAERFEISPHPVPSPIGLLPLAEDRYALGIGLPFGSMPAEKLIALTRHALALDATEIRLAPGRALLCLGLSPSACASLRDTAASVGFVTDATDPRLRIAVCPGAPACASGRIATRDIAETIAAESSDLLDASLALHISGCAKGCAHPGPAALTLVGGDNGAGLVVNGTAKALPAGYRPGYDAARGIGRVAAAIRNARHPGETAVARLARLGTAGVTEAYQQE
ncbi:precorrin-3B synthase [Mesorhizobium sp. M00.F.Ca.ET.216.01.1.1]|uniref:precorrin-3B synthase n=1 Tax=Mesorhizobium sp. M00.F.Ca.ET.216.01.1.1 TaxID=2500528 RepID=UPI000FDA814B|nr:precorrin-3B synthase [Mesorhizobium sp. M00.F.Ca.ET.216.01.1.1]TGQ39789.1 precorrin-3B synthase [Mesorhizobium sp. M00.F.Ca.ET.216.01.1.1]TJW13356.1 MAG: precorrin-3B synthase [Mesorhizobium sp.]TJW43073.1 MAG: precorrin-3B synthase [Mesorhizobium sp.]